MLKLPIEYYVTRMANEDYFSLAGYSDAEWYSMIGHSLGKRTGLGQILDGTHGTRLLDVLKRRKDDARFLLAAPCCMWEDDYFTKTSVTQKMEEFCVANDLNDICWHERDMITDDLARLGGLYPLIKQLQAMPVVIIGNGNLRRVDFLNYKHFVEISSPNLHMEPGGIENAVRDAASYGKPGVYLVSAGVSAAVIIDQLHNKLPESFLIDCGSIWDAFVRIGSQRGWRRELYGNPEKYELWKHKCLTGTGDVITYGRPNTEYG